MSMASIEDTSGELRILGYFAFAGIILESIFASFYMGHH